jgi:hypothetical protein
MCLFSLGTKWDAAPGIPWPGQDAAETAKVAENANNMKMDCQQGTQDTQDTQVLHQGTQDTQDTHTQLHHPNWIVPRWVGTPVLPQLMDISPSTSIRNNPSNSIKLHQIHITIIFHR